MTSHGKLLNDRAFEMIWDQSAWQPESKAEAGFVFSSGSGEAIGASIEASKADSST